MKIFLLTDTHFGISMNNLDKNLSMMELTFYEFVIPFLLKNAQKGDIVFHLGDLFDNRTSIPIIVMNKVEKILRKISEILPIHILVGNHDLYNKGSNEVNSVRLFSYISNNIHLYENPTEIEIEGTKISIIPWVEKRVDMIETISKMSGKYLFCHSDLNGCKMHLSSVAHRNADKIDIESFERFKNVFSGHIHITQSHKNFRFIGSLYQMDRNDIGDQKGITIIDIDTDEISFEPNTYSPVFKKIYVKTDDDVTNLESIMNTKDYIDLIISNSLLINNRKIRRKLEIFLENGNFASVEYLDDVMRESKELEEKSMEIGDDGLPQISINLDYEQYIKNYILSQKYESEKIKNGIINEFDEIVRIYNSK